MTRRKATSDLWWKNAVVYCLDVQTFLDSDGDGCGDLPGLIERMDYLAGIGVTCIWLMPFHPSPERDDGYDIVDFYAVDPKLGTLGDFADMVRTAGDRGIRVIADLVVNHTSVRHPWFQDARAARDSPYRGFYVWRDDKPEERPGDVVFPDEEDSNWAYDEQAGQWYLHRFYREQPDLNVANPEVRDELAQIAGFWAQQGLAGFRVDAVPFLIEPVGLPEGAIEDPHELLADLRAYLGRRRGDAILLGEVNLPPAQQRDFFGRGGRRELDLVFNFHAMQAMYLALARQDATPLEEAMDRLPEIPEDCQWATFVRNHDELTLDQLSPEEREEVFAAFGPTRTCSSTAAACAGGCRRCSPAIRPGSGWSTRWRSRCPGPPCSSTGRRSGWARTSTSRAGSASARRCSGRPSPTAASRRPPTRTTCAAR